ncbi:pre-mRNA-splicing factor syf1 [Anaeramoeba flamelloides]|uniref:Pre-mRNA-splicing factor syf1 n=1 Tax=Anaeramoeba flamelloides TaxID=1746091 RepID=A0ABQ8Z1H4_9EUKA|nr:pre-mRNA-splicing factor syf1 [Anaeramoeba flamelloides]
MEQKFNLFPDLPEKTAVWEDRVFEDNISNDPYKLKNWILYLQHKNDSAFDIRSYLFRRALNYLPRSYKLWNLFLIETRAETSGRRIDDEFYSYANGLHEKALVHMNKMPRIWEDYLQFLIKQRFITKTRRTFDNALVSLPITQHFRIWPLYLNFAKSCDVSNTTKHVFRRYLMIFPERVDELIDYLIDSQFWNEAAIELTKIINKGIIPKKSKKTLKDYWLLLCQICSKYPEKIIGFDVESVIRSGFEIFSTEEDDISSLWISLADYHVKLGHFEKARDIYEEGFKNVKSVKAFSEIFDAYTKFEETMISIQLSMQEEEEEEDDEDEDGEDGKNSNEDANNFSIKSLKKNNFNKKKDLELELDLRFSRLEDLEKRRPFLVNNVLLKKNPNSVEQWLEKIKLNQDDPEKVMKIYLEALETIDPFETEEDISTIWIDFAAFYEQNGNLNETIKIYERAIAYGFNQVKDLINVWCSYAEFEIRSNNFEKARELLRRATHPQPNKNKNKNKKKKPKNELENRIENRIEKETGKKKEKNERIEIEIEKEEEEEEEEEENEENEENKNENKTNNNKKKNNKHKRINVNKLNKEEKRIYYKKKNLSRRIRNQLHRSVRLWGFYVDVEECLGTIKTTKSIYDEMIKMKVITPQIILNYASFLESSNYFEESFKAYEKGLEVFDFPYSYDIWVAYLTKFIQRYKGTKIERTRDLFEEVINQSPREYAKIFYLYYAHFEQQYGFIRHSMKIYDRASQNVSDKEKYEIFQVFIHKATKYFGITQTREVYDRSIELSPDKDLKYLTMQYAAMETTLGEIDRARAIYVHGSQFCNPRSETDFWDTWDKFERTYGNKATFQEFSIIKRTILAKFNLTINLNIDNLSNDQQNQKKESLNSIELLELENPQSNKRSELDEINNNINQVNDILNNEEVLTMGMKSAAPMIKFQPKKKRKKIQKEKEQPEENNENANLPNQNLTENNLDENFEITEKELPSTLLSGISSEKNKSPKDNLGALARFSKK